MKIVNHKKENYSNINGTIMHGTIEMTMQEWADVEKYLRNEYKKALKKCDTYKRDVLMPIFGQKHFLAVSWNERFCIGVTATTLFCYHFAVVGYKTDRNYQIIIN